MLAAGLFPASPAISRAQTQPAQTIVGLVAESAGLQIVPADQWGQGSYWIARNTLPSLNPPLPAPPANTNIAVYAMADGQFVCDFSGGDLIVPRTRAGRTLTASEIVRAQTEELLSLISEVQARQVAIQMSMMTADSPPVPGGADGTNTWSEGTVNIAPSFVPPTGFGPCETYRNFWFSRSTAASGIIHLTLSNTLAGLGYVILQAADLSGASWTSVDTFTATGFESVLDPISAGANTTLFFRAKLAADYAAPLILSPPQDVVVAQGSPATFSIVATANPAPGYQWWFGGTPISGATASTLTIPSAQPANVGIYTVVVSNPVCQVSASASLGLSWTNLLDGQITASPAVGSDGTIYVPTSTSFYALDPVLGAVKWSTNIANIDPGNLAPSAAVAANNSAVFVASQGGGVMAYNPTNGVMLWSNYLGGAIYSSPAVSAADGTVYVTAESTYSSGLLAFNPATGATNWVFQPDDPYPLGVACNSSPAVGKDCTIYFVAASGDLFAVHPDGSLAWFFPFPAYYYPQSSPALDQDGNIVIGSADGYIYCINPAGGLKWIFNTGGSNTAIDSPAVGADGTVYAASADGTLFALTNGVLAWEFNTTTSFGYPLFFASSPAVTTNNVVLIGAAYGTSQTTGLYAITNGAVMAFHPTTDIFSSPTVNPADGGVLVGDMGGSLYKFPGAGKLATDAPWPAFRYNAPHTAALPNPACSGAGPSAFPNNPALSTSLTTFSFVLSGTPGTWTIYASANLADWTPIATVAVPPASGNAQFTDSAVGGLTSRFYQARAAGVCSPIIGFINQLILPGTNLLANPLYQVNAHAYPQNAAKGWTALLNNNGLPTPPDGTEISKWNGHGFDEVTWYPPGSAWSPSGDLTLLPGQATFFVNTNAAATIPFMGLVPPGATTNAIAAGTNFVSSLLPKAGLLHTDLGFNPNNGDQVLLWRTNHYQTNTYSAGSWSSGEPSLRLGEGFLLLSTLNTNWTTSAQACPSLCSGVPFFVSANPLWTDTGCVVGTGDVITVTATGKWKPATGAEYGPQGGGQMGGWFLSNTYWGALIAFVGPNPYCDDQGSNRWHDASYFPRPQGTNYWLIGAGTNFTATRTGRLWFGINDDAPNGDVGDNSGNLTVSAQITHP